MALHVKKRLAGDRADLGQLVVAQPDRARLVAKRGDVVEVGADVDLSPGLPGLKVVRDVIVARLFVGLYVSSQRSSNRTLPPGAS